MTKHDAAFLSCRILALWIFTKVAIDLSVFAVTFFWLLEQLFRKESSSNIGIMSLFAVVPALALIAVGTVLWQKSDKIANRIFPSNGELEPPISGNLTADDLMSLAFGVTGMYVVVYTVPNLARHLLTPQLRDIRLVDAWQDGKWQLEFWLIILQIGLGIWLMVGMRGIARFIRSLQRRDLANDNKDSTAAPSS